MKHFKIRSMTGFGQSRFQTPLLKGRVEIRSVNHRFFDFSARLPIALSPLESRIKEFLSKELLRGKVSVSISLNGHDETEPVLVDPQKVRFYSSQFKKLGKRFGFDSALTVGDIIRLPNVFEVAEKEQDPEKLWKKVQPALSIALDHTLRMREREGQALVRDLMSRLHRIEVLAQKIEKLSPDLVTQHQDKLQKKIAELTSSTQLDASRLEQEVALFAQHHDITEELVRLKSHMVMFNKILQSGKEVGKKLDFLMQEINREANTMASKALSSQISQYVVEMKTELEKIREQIQNIE